MFEDAVMRTSEMHYDNNGWPCIGRYVGKIIDDGDSFIFMSPEDEIMANEQFEMNKYFYQYLVNNFPNENS